jgi:phosphatidylglycerophosphatase A
MVIGVVASGAYGRRQAVEDPQEVVIDEVAGQLLALSLAPPHWGWYLAGFALFRLFDITKPFPASWCDRNVKGGLGVMADDLVAGLYAMILIALGDYLVRSI